MTSAVTKTVFLDTLVDLCRQQGTVCAQTGEMVAAAAWFAVADKVEAHEHQPAATVVHAVRQFSQKHDRTTWIGEDGNHHRFSDRLEEYLAVAVEQACAVSATEQYESV